MTIGDTVTILEGDLAGKTAVVAGLGEQQKEFPLVYLKIPGETKPDLIQMKANMVQRVEKTLPREGLTGED